jgi:hypothetical protein
VKSIKSDLVELETTIIESADLIARGIRIESRNLLALRIDDGTLFQTKSCMVTTLEILSDSNSGKR